MNPARVAANMLSKTELSAYLSRTPRRCELAYRLKYCLDDGVREELRRFLLIFASGIAADEEWPTERGKTPITNMINLAMDELKDNIPGDNWQVRAKALGVDQKEWCSVWRTKYAEIYRELDDWVNTAYRQVWRMQE